MFFSEQTYVQMPGYPMNRECAKKEDGKEERKEGRKEGKQVIHDLPQSITDEADLSLRHWLNGDVQKDEDLLPICPFEELPWIRNSRLLLCGLLRGFGSGAS